MKRMTSGWVCSLGALAFVCGGSAALAGNPANGWVITGPSQSGGNIISAPANTTVGQLDMFTDPATSQNGGDVVIVNQGVTVDASNAFGAAVILQASNNTFINNGAVVAPSFDQSNGPFSNTGVGFFPGFNGNALVNTTFVNNSFIFGGDGDSDEEFSNAGLSIVSFGGIYNTSITNLGFIRGGSNGGGFSATLGDGIELVDQNGIADINNVSLVNAGFISGGTNVNDAEFVGNGVVMVSEGNVTNINITNTASGIIQGGANNQLGYGVGNGVLIMASPDNPDHSLSNVKIFNAGQILGGANSIIPNGVNVPPMYVLGSGVVLWGANGVFNVDIANSGSIIGGANSLESVENVEDEFNESLGAVAGSGLAIFDANNFLNEPNDINGVRITNSGVIVGGDGSGNAVIAGSAIGIVSGGNVANIQIGNTSTGQILGGNNGNGNTGNDQISNFDSGTVVLGSGIGIAAGVTDNNNFSVINVDINNAGLIKGGNNSFDADIVGSAIGIWSGNGIYNVSIENSGSILGGSNNEGSDILSMGIGIYDASFFGKDINGVSINNSGVISGGSNSGEATMAASGIGIAGGDNVLNVLINNTATGVISGGTNAGGVNTMVGTGIGVEAGFRNSTGFIANFTLNNAGAINGGNNTGDGDIVGTGVGLYGVNGVYNTSIHNAGSIIGGNNNGAGTIVGAGIGIFDEDSNDRDIANVLIVNSGGIYGGNFNEEGTLVGVGVGVLGNGNVNNVLIVNSGTISGGDNNAFGDIVGDGIVAGSEGGNFTNALVVNYGLIKGGLGAEGDEGFDGGDGVDMGGDNAVVNIGVVNSGRIIGGNGGNSNSLSEGSFVGGDGGAGVDIGGSFGANVNVANSPSGVILGGNGGNGKNGGAGGDGGTGVELDFDTTSSATITNFGFIGGGNGGANGFAGIGVNTFGGNTTINNWGVIQAGAGASQAEVAGFPAVAVLVNGNNNTINLNGHSAVYGTIEGQGSNNVLNLNFTGVSLLEKQNLLAQLVAQGYPANNFTGAFTFRGVTYYIDPVVLNVNVSSYQLQGITPNQQAVGANLDSFTVNPTGPTLALLNAIDQSGAVPIALDALSPQRYQIYGDLAQAAVNFQTLEIDHRLNNLRDGSESIDTIGLGGNDDKTTAGFSKDGKDNKHVAVPEKAPEKRWGFFAAGQGVFGSIDGHGGDLSDANFTSAGLLMGVDGKINDNWVAGLLFDYSHTEADLDNQGSTANVDTYGGGIYTGYHNGGWYANGLGSYGHNTYDSNRVVAFPGFAQTARAGTDGNQYGLNLDGGYDFKINDRLTVGPLLGLEYVHLDVNGFNEWGAGPANLAVGSQNMDSLRSRLGFRADYHVACCKNVAWAVEGRAAWQHEFLDDSRSISSSFIGSGLGAFNVQTTKPQRDAALLGVGVNATIRDRWTVFVDYDVQVGQESYLEQSVKGGLKVSF